MATTQVTNELMTDTTGQSIATAIGNMSVTSVGNLSALTTTDKTSLVGAVNELKSGLTSKIGVSSTTNLNESWTTGIYTFAWNATGVPSGHSGTMLVMRIPNSDSGVQIARVSTENIIYVRFFDSAVFTAWQTITLGS